MVEERTDFQAEGPAKNTTSKTEFAVETTPFDVYWGKNKKQLLESIEKMNETHNIGWEREEGVRLLSMDGDTWQEKVLLRERQFCDRVLVGVEGATKDSGNSELIVLFDIDGTIAITQEVDDEPVRVLRPSFDTLVKYIQETYPTTRVGILTSDGKLTEEQVQRFNECDSGQTNRSEEERLEHLQAQTSTNVRHILTGEREHADIPFERNVATLFDSELMYSTRNRSMHGVKVWIRRPENPLFLSAIEAEGFPEDLSIGEHGRARLDVIADVQDKHPNAYVVHVCDDLGRSLSGRSNRLINVNDLKMP